jgi:DNA mismatch repair protein MutL
MNQIQSTIGSPRIRILPPEVVQLIAAGEVIERPASVVKELVENSIDAGARKISVAVREAPDRLLRVLDDGCGMSEEEAHLALKRHATSKLFDAADLQQIRTLGFRGEALPTIAQVSRLTLSTRAESSLGGVQIEVAGGAILTAGPVGRPPGTTITVADLFFNTPARRKFLRSARGEMRAVMRVVSSYALMLPGVHFLLSEDEKEVLNLPPVDGLRARAAAVFGAEAAEELVEVVYLNPLLEVRGLVGGPEIHRGNRDHQTFYINGRWVQNPLLGHAVRTAYRNRIPAGRHPLAILELTLDPRSVDVNVHPTKREIKFSREHEVYGALVRAVEAALRETSPRLGEAVFVRRESRGEPPPMQFSLARDLAGTELDSALAELKAGEVIHDRPAGASLAVTGAISVTDAAAATAAGAGAEWEARPGELVPLWQLHHTYIFCPVKGGVLIVDQHVAHERVLYERALIHLREREAAGQALLFPEILDLSPADLDLVQEAEPWLTRLGFDLRVLGDRSVAVHAVPARIERWERGRFLLDLVETLGRERRAGAALEEAVAASYACHAAVRKGDPLNLAEMNRLVEDLFACDMPLACPHGRPIVVKLSLDDLDRRFGRT